MATVKFIMPSTGEVHYHAFPSFSDAREFCDLLRLQRVVAEIM